jgi:hypothetical protein
MITLMAFVSIVMASTLHSQRGCRVVAFNDPGFGWKCAQQSRVFGIVMILHYSRNSICKPSDLAGTQSGEVAVVVEGIAACGSSAQQTNTVVCSLRICVQHGSTRAHT